MHSEFSADCDTPTQSVINAAIDKGLRSICITDHNDLDFPEVPDNIKFDLDIEKYISTLGALREKYADEIDLRIGVEQGLMPETCERLSNYSAIHPGLDFIICSSHVVSGMDPYYPETFGGNDPMSIYRMYFEDMLTVTQNFEDYSVYGHIDYIFRYGPGKVSSDGFDIKPYRELLTLIFKNIIGRGKGIEINTGSLYRGMDYMHPHRDILKLYKDLGGEIITFGSDTHDTEHIGHLINDAAEYARDLGFRFYAEYKDMKPEMKPL